MKYSLVLACLLTGCGIVPTQQIVGTDGRTYTWIAPIGSGDGYASGRSAQVNTYVGTVNGRGYSVQSFR
jgi:hypothetical protein